MENFSYLMSTLNVRGYTYRNRIVTAPTLFAHSVFIPEISENVYRMVERRAQGGAAEVSTGEICVNFEEGICAFAEPFDYGKLEGSVFNAFKKYAERIKKHGAIAMIELCHEGAKAETAPGVHPWGPDHYIREDGVEVFALDEAMMQKICNDFAQAAKFMKKAGFDGILVHGGHGFLVQQFMSPWTNHRTDKYGGTMYNRARFPAMLLDAIREAIGPDMLLELRISAQDSVPGGLQIAETVEFCRIIDGKADIIHVSNGLKWLSNRSGTFSDMFDPHGCNVQYAAEIKKAVKLTKVSVIGGINSPEMGEKIIREGKADLIVLGRQAYADPEFANKAAAGKEHLIRRCVRCFQCYPGYKEHKTDLSFEEMGFSADEIGQILNPASMGKCAINPASNFRLYPERFPAPKSKRNVLIIGGGPAGMQAAITANERGHSVVLLEKTEELGGVLKFTDRDGDKEDLRNFKNVLINELQERNITVIKNTEADLDLIRKYSPDTIILAVGSHANIPAIPGIEDAINAKDAYENLSGIGKHVVMVGGGLVGCEVSLALAKGRSIEIIEREDRIAPETYRMYRTALLDEMDKRGIVQHLGYKCTKIQKNGVLCVDRAGGEKFFAADTVCFSLGMSPNKRLKDELAAFLGDKKIFVVGDCNEVGKVGDAICSAYMASMQII